jgi:hypothetical protein
VVVLEALDGPLFVLRLGLAEAALLNVVKDLPELIEMKAEMIGKPVCLGAVNIFILVAIRN